MLVYMFAVSKGDVLFLVVCTRITHVNTCRRYQHMFPMTSVSIYMYSLPSYTRARAFSMLCRLQSQIPD
jgi:hypothetical protein